jgi:hypothetical protein
MKETGMRKALVCAALAMGLAAACPAQGLTDELNFRSATVGGVHLYGLSVYTGYSSSAYPLNGPAQLPPGTGLLGDDFTYGATATMGWQRHRDRTSLTMMYTGSYGGMARHSNLNAFGHSASLGMSRALSGKWTVTVNGAAQDATMAQYLFQPMELSLVAQMPATFDDLAAAFSIGQFSNAQIAAMLTGAPVLVSPARSLLLGNRILSYSGQAGLNYAYSSRLSFHVSSFSAGGQNRRNGQEGIPQENYVMPRSMGVSGGGGFSYSLSPRTQIGLDAEEQRIQNRYQGAYTTTGSGSFGRKMGMHWFLRARGGATVTHIVQQAYGTPKTRQMVGGGALGFQTYAHTLLASYDRGATDTYGFAVGTNTTVSGSWNYHRRDSAWNLFASFGQQQMRNNGFADISGWQATAGWSRRTSAHTSFTAQYVYMSSKGEYQGTVNDLAVHSVRLSVGWTPEPNYR